MTAADIPMQVALAEIRGELKTIAHKLEAGDESSAHLFELLKEQLSYQRNSLDELKVGVQAVRDDSRSMITAMRLDVEEQILEVKEALENHSSLKNPHPNQEDWIREADKRLLHEVGSLRNEYDKRLKALEDEATLARGALEARKPLNSFLVGVLSAISAAVAIAIVLGVLDVVSFK